MDTIERLVLDLPAELVAKLREQVAAGDFRSESEAVETMLKFHFVDDDLEADELEAFVPPWPKASPKPMQGAFMTRTRFTPSCVHG